MKVYELINKLSEMPAGMEVKIDMIKSLDELPEIEDDLREINFVVKEITKENHYVRLDGWTE